MQLFIMRHGEAEASLGNDALRNLTDNGRADVLQMADTYRDALAEVDAIWASPYVRAQQTAQLMAGELNKAILTQPFLPPNGNPLDVLNALSQQNSTLLLVSHQPLVSILVDGLAALEPGRYRMGTASLACLSGDIFANGCCELRWLHQPASMQAMYG